MRNLIKLLVILMPSLVFCQGKDTIHKNFPKVKFNFKAPKSITIPKTIKVGDFYQIEIDGINLNRYFVSLKASDTTYSKPLEFPTFGKIDLSGLTDLTNSLKNNIVAKKVETTDSISGLAKIVPFSESIFTQKSVSFHNIYILEELYPKVKDSPKKLIKKQIEINKLRALEFSTDLLIAKKAIDEKEFNYVETRILRKTIDNNTNHNINIKTDLKDFKDLRLTLKEVKNENDKAIKKSEKFIEDTQGVKAFLLDPKNISLKEKFTKSKEQLELTSKKINNIIEIISSKKIEQMMMSVLNLYRENKYVSLPIQFTEEEAKVEIFFIPKDSTSNLQKYSLSPIKFPKKQNYWSVGTAIYFSGIKSERVGYETIAINDSVSKIKVLQEPQTNGEIGTAILLRAGKISENGFGKHIVVGTGVSLSEDILPRAMFGGGFSYGKKHSITFDAGINIGNTKVISKNIDFNKEYLEKPDVFINQLKVSYFFALGYSFRL